MTKHLLILALLVSTACSAWAGSARVFKLFLNQHRIFATATGDIQEGSQMTATFPDGGSCPLFVSRIKGRNASLDTSKCPQENSIRVGQVLTDTSPDLEMSEAGLPASRASAHDVLDLMYVPAKGKFSITGTAKMAQPKQSITLATGSLKLYDDSAKSTTLSALLGYGVTDQVAVGLQLSTQSSSHSYTYGPASTLNGQNSAQGNSGMQDPILEGKFRAIEQERGAVDLDLGFAYSPKLGSAVSAEGTSNGNAYRGGDVMTLDAEVGQKRGPWQFSGEFLYSMVGAQTGSTALTSTKTSSAAFNIMSLDGFAQFEINRWLAIRGRVGAQSLSAQSSTYNGSPSISEGSFMQTNFGVAGVVPVIPHKLAITLQFQSFMAANPSGSLNSNTASASTSDQQISAWVTGEF